MTRSPFAAHRAASTALLSIFLLAALGFTAGDPRILVALVGASALSLWVTTRPAAAAALGAFVSPLASAVDLSLLFLGIWATGGTASPLVLLLPAFVALAWVFEGRPAARFHALLSVLAFGAFLVSIPAPAAGELWRLVAIGLAAPALLAALEASASGKRAERADRAPAAEAATPASDREAAILHDLKSPLSVIRVYADLVQEAARRGELPDPEHLANLSREIELAQKLAGASEAAAPAEGMAPVAAPSADLVEILGSLATAYRLSLAGRLRVEFIAERPQLPVAADPVALQRAFRNVLENAIKYTPDGGEIRIRAGAAGPHAFVVVKDTGVGMSPEERERAFEYAFRGSGAVASGRPGKGLGLALTKQILEANGGKIALSSESGYGSEVTILIPFQRGAR